MSNEFDFAPFIVAYYFKGQEEGEIMYEGIHSPDYLLRRIQEHTQYGREFQVYSAHAGHPRGLPGFRTVQDGPRTTSGRILGEGEIARARTQFVPAPIVAAFPYRVENTPGSGEGEAKDPGSCGQEETPQGGGNESGISSSSGDVSVDSGSTDSV